MASERVQFILEELFQDAMRGKRLPTYPKIGTIKAMADLGNAWHDYQEVQRELGKVQNTGNVYCFYLARLYPDLIEVDLQKRVRIKPSLYPITRKLVNEYAERILSIIAEKRKENSQ